MSNTILTVTGCLLLFTITVGILICLYLYYNNVFNIKRIDNNTNKTSYVKICDIVYFYLICIMTLTVIIILLITFLQFNPTERTHEEIKTITEEVIDKNYKLPVKEVINKLEIDKKIKKQKATKDNNTAMEEATNLFN